MCAPDVHTRLGPQGALARSSAIRLTIRHGRKLLRYSELTLKAANSWLTIGNTTSRNAFKPALLSPVANEPWAALGALKNAAARQREMQ